MVNKITHDKYIDKFKLKIGIFSPYENLLFIGILATIYIVFVWSLNYDVICGLSSSLL